MTPPTLDQILAKHRAGMLPEAERLYLQLLDAQPDHPVALHLLGVLAYQTGRLALAAERMGRAVALKPDFPEALSNLGNALKDLGRIDEAMDCYGRAMALKPDFPEPRHNLGSVLHGLGRLDEAIAAYSEAIRLRPDYADCLSNLALALWEAERSAEAVDLLRRALALRPDHTEALSNLGMILLKQDRPGEALGLLRRAVAGNPNHVRAWANLGLALEDTGEIEEAAQAHERAMRQDPAFDDALARLIHLRRKLCQWDRFASDDARLLDQIRGAKHKIPPFIALHSPGATPADHRAAARRWATDIKPPEGLAFTHGPRAAGSRLHIGYLSADLRAHPVGFLLGELVERHDRQRFIITAYSYGADDSSPTRRRLEAAFDRFIPIDAMNDAEAARRIHADGVDILVDLTGYTTGARTAILAARPAPIQVNYLGYAGTMGASFMDVIIADPAIAPLSEQDLFDERIIHLPNSYLPFDTMRQVPEHGPSRAQCGLPEGGVVFCAFHNSFKITPMLFDVWMRLLAAVPGSVLWLLEAFPATADNLRQEARARGVDPHRLVFAPRVGIETYLARHRLADLFLDALPYNAHGSAADALWMGLPVLTCRGSTFPGRVAGRLLSELGLDELVSESLADYEAKALELARDPGRLAGLRQRLERDRRLSPVFQMDGFTRNLEDAFMRLGHGLAQLP